MTTDELRAEVDTTTRCEKHSRYLARLPSFHASHCPECLVVERDEAMAEVERLKAVKKEMEATHNDQLATVAEAWRTDRLKMRELTAKLAATEREREAFREACERAENLCELLIADGTSGPTSDAMIPRVMRVLRAALAPYRKRAALAQGEDANVE